MFPDEIEAVRSQLPFGVHCAQDSTVYNQLLLNTQEGAKVRGVLWMFQ